VAAFLPGRSVVAFHGAFPSSHARRRAGKLAHLALISTIAIYGAYRAMLQYPLISPRDEPTICPAHRQSDCRLPTAEWVTPSRLAPPAGTNTVRK
jgi:hypothetical protein